MLELVVLVTIVLVQTAAVSPMVMVQPVVRLILKHLSLQMVPKLVVLQVILQEWFVVAMEISGIV